MAVAAASFIAGTTFAISDTPVSPAEAEKIKTALEAFGCTADEMEKSESSVFAFEVDDAKCKDGEYDIKLDEDFKIIIMLPRQPALVLALPSTAR
jgi:hypothetical protein